MGWFWWGLSLVNHGRNYYISTGDTPDFWTINRRWGHYLQIPLKYKGSSPSSTGRFFQELEDSFHQRYHLDCFPPYLLVKKNVTSTVPKTNSSHLAGGRNPKGTSSSSPSVSGATVDGSETRRSPVYPIIYMVSYMSGGWEWDFFHQQTVCCIYSSLDAPRMVYWAFAPTSGAAGFFSIKRLLVSGRVLHLSSN